MVVVSVIRSGKAEESQDTLPPSSRVTRLMSGLASWAMRWPTAVLPVNEIMRTSGWVQMASPTCVG